VPRLKRSSPGLPRPIRCTLNLETKRLETLIRHLAEVMAVPVGAEEAEVEEEEELPVTGKHSPPAPLSYRRVLTSFPVARRHQR
jgi:hypothetical protein